MKYKRSLKTIYDNVSKTNENTNKIIAHTATIPEMIYVPKTADDTHIAVTAAAYERVLQVSREYSALRRCGEGDIQIAYIVII